MASSDAEDDALRLAENVIRMVTRAFYEHEAVVVLDGLLHLNWMTKNSVRDQDLATEMKLQHRMVRKVLSQLEHDNLLQSVERKETHGNREVLQQYWRVNHKMALDAIKLRLKRMENAMQEAPVERRTQYECRQCEGGGAARGRVKVA